MQYDAVTLDSNIFFRNGFYLEGGMLGQLVQFKEGSAQFALSEIVIREVYKYLKIEGAEANGDLEKAIKKCSKNGVLSTDAIAQLKSIHDAALGAGDAAKKRLETFLNNAGCIIVTADKADIKELIKRYFAPSAPFEQSGKKKNEFPDAIALLSLEAWAKSNDKKILAISDDGGWVDFAKNSEFIDVERDLAAALQKLQKHTEQAELISGIAHFPSTVESIVPARKIVD
jgi:PIN domain-containing protein